MTSPTALTTEESAPLIVGFGSKIIDTSIEPMAPELWGKFTKKVEAYTEELNRELVKKGEKPVDSILTEKGGHQDLLYPVFKEFIEENKNALILSDNEGGSVYNDFSSARAEGAEDAKYVHIVSSPAHTFAFIHPVSGEKIMGTFRESKKDLKLSEEDRKAIAEATVILLPKSSFNGFPGVIREIYDIVEAENPNAQIVATFHGSDYAKNIDLMLEKALTLIGNKVEMGREDRKKFEAFFERSKDPLIVVTDGENGLTMYNKAFKEPTGSNKKYFPTIPQKLVDSLGAGNAAEGGVIALRATTGKNGEKLTMEQLENAGDTMNGAGAFVVTILGSDIHAEKHKDEIKRIIEAVSDNRKRLEIRGQEGSFNPKNSL